MDPIFWQCTRVDTIRHGCGCRINTQCGGSKLDALGSTGLPQFMGGVAKSDTNRSIPIADQSRAQRFLLSDDQNSEAKRKNKEKDIKK